MEQTQLTQVITASQRGDPQAQESLIQETQDHIFYQCRKILGNQQDAEDATQDILIRMLEKLSTLQAPEAFWGWLNRITANHCKNLLTRGKRDCQIPEDEEGNSLLDTYENLDDQLVPDKALDNNETQRMVVELVDALPAAQRMCVMLYYYDEMPVKEIAAVLEVSENTVKSRLNYARKSIKEGVEGYEKQGIKLYGATPLPFLLYFLQKDAQIGGMSIAAKAAMAESVLSAGAGTAAVSAGGGTAGAAAVTKAAVGVGAKATGIVGSKVAIGLAGVAIAGAVAGGAYLATRPAPAEPTPEPTPTPVVEVFVPIEPAVSTSEPPLTPTPEPMPEYSVAPTFLPEATLEPGPEPKTTSESASIKHYYMELDKGTTPNDGLNWLIKMGSGNQSADPGSYIFSSSDPSIVVVDSITGNYTTLSTGTATLSAISKEDPNERYYQTITVRDRFGWSYTNPEQIVASAGGSVPFNLAPYGLPRLTRIVSVSWESMDPAIAVAEKGRYSMVGTIYGISPGTTTIVGEFEFEFQTVLEDYATATDIVSFEVTVCDDGRPENLSPAPEFAVTEVAASTVPTSAPTPEMNIYTAKGTYRRGENFSLTDFFSALPGDLTYSSSDEAIVYIDKDGRMSALSSGNVTIISESEGEHKRYLAEVEVLDEFAWSHQFREPVVTINVGEEFTNYLDYWSTVGEVKECVWSSDIPSVVSAKAREYNKTDCVVFGISPGNATITGIVTFEVKTRAGTQTMTDTISFQVTVAE